MMKDKIYIPTLLLVMFYLLTLGAPVAALAGSRHSESSTSWQDLKLATYKKLEQLDANLHALGKKIEGSNKKAKHEFNELIENTRTAKKDIAEIFDKIGNETKEFGKSVQKEIDAAILRLENSYHRLKADLSQ